MATQNGMYLYPAHTALTNHISNTPPMQHKCVACDRIFRSNVSLDKHKCHQPAQRTSNSAPSATGVRRRAEPDSPTRLKRARIGTEPSHPDEGAPFEQGPYEHDHAGPGRSPPPEIPRQPTRSARSGRIVRIPRRLVDYVPHGDMSLSHVPPRAPTPSERDDRSVSPATVETPTPGVVA